MTAPPAFATGYKVMFTIRSFWRVVSVRGFLISTVLTAAAMLFANAVQADDYIGEMREAARTWAMHRIAVIQAAAGDVQGAKRTASQIGRRWDQGPTKVTGVWFRCGQPVYDRPPYFAPAYWQCLACKKPAARGVPAQVPPGLRANYLDPDPRHGAVVDFTDEYDSHGTRVTSRKYADGYVVIETPCRGSAAGR